MKGRIKVTKQVEKQLRDLKQALGDAEEREAAVWCRLAGVVSGTLYGEELSYEELKQRTADAHDAFEKAWFEAGCPEGYWHPKMHDSMVAEARRKFGQVVA